MASGHRFLANPLKYLLSFFHSNWILAEHVNVKNKHYSSQHPLHLGMAGRVTDF